MSKRRSPAGGRLYLNGALAAIFDPTAVANQNQDNAGQLLLRAASNVVSGAKIFLDEVGIYDRAIKPVEVASIYNAHHSGKCVP